MTFLRDGSRSFLIATGSEELPELPYPGGQLVDVAGDLVHEAVVAVGDRRALRGRDDYPLLLQEFERVSDPVLGDSRHLGQPDQSDRLVPLNRLQNGDVPLEKLEAVTRSFPGIDSCYAIQAGREIRVMVKPDEVSEDQMVLLARDIAKKIENELTYPGQIKVHVLRETKAVEYAK